MSSQTHNSQKFARLLSSNLNLLSRREFSLSHEFCQLSSTSILVGGARMVVNELLAVSFLHGLYFIFGRGVGEEGALDAIP